MLFDQVVDFLKHIPVLFYVVIFGIIIFGIISFIVKKVFNVFIFIILILLLAASIITILGLN